MEISAVDAALIAAEQAGFDEVVVLGLKYEDGLIRLHTSMDYMPDIFMTLHMAARLMLENGTGKLND